MNEELDDNTLEEEQFPGRQTVPAAFTENGSVLARRSPQEFMEPRVPRGIVSSSLAALPSLKENPLIMQIQQKAQMIILETIYSVLMQKMEGNPMADTAHNQ